MQKQQNQSDVARLLARISIEYEAAERGLHGLTAGTLRHEFIIRKMERMSELHRELQTLVGDSAIALVAVELEQRSSPTHNSLQ